MGCCGDREKGIKVSEEQKWTYITLSDFRSSSCIAPLSYIWLWILVITSIAVYAADAFTCVNLLAFNKWSSQVKPAIPIDIAKWIFSITIIISYVFLLYRWYRAVIVVRSGGVAESYLEPLAAIYQSLRMGKNGQGWRRFLVFAELTKSREGTDYLILFVYFQFKGALLIIIAQGPRIAINALTLWGVMQANLLPVGEHKGKDTSNFVQFFKNIEIMTQTGNKQETIIYFTMLFSLVIWVIAALSLLLSLIFYIVYVARKVRSKGGSLSKYCRGKIETRLDRIVGEKVQKALEKEVKQQRRDEERAIKKGELDAKRAPTLPKIGGRDDDTSSAFSMARSDTFSTVSTLPPYSSNAPSRTNTMSTARTAAMKGPTLPSLSERPSLSRTETNSSYASNAPLLSDASSMGRSSPAPPMPTLDLNSNYFGAQPRNGPPSGLSNQSYSQMTQSRPYSPMSQGRASPQPPRNALPPVNTDTGHMAPGPYLVSPLPNDPRSLPYSPGNGQYPNRRPAPSPLGDPTFSPYDTQERNMGPAYEMSPVEINHSDDILSHYYSNSNESNEYKPPQIPAALRAGSPAPPSMPNTHVSPPPSRSGTAPPSNPRAGLPAGLQSAIQRREASNPFPARGQMNATPQQRSATAPIQPPEWAQGAGPRSNTTAPSQEYGLPSNPGPRSNTTAPGGSRNDSFGQQPYGGNNRW